MISKNPEASFVIFCVQRKRQPNRHKSKKKKKEKKKRGGRTARPWSCCGRVSGGAKRGDARVPLNPSRSLAAPSLNHEKEKKYESKCLFFVCAFLFPIRPPKTSNPRFYPLFTSNAALPSLWPFTLNANEEKGEASEKAHPVGIEPTTTKPKATQSID